MSNQEPLDDLPTTNTGDSERSWQDFAHFLYSEKHKKFHTEIKSPDAMSVLDTATVGYIKSDFAGTGLEKDVEKFVDYKRTNWVANGRARAKETENIASAAAQKEEAKAAFRERLLGSLDR